MVVQPWCMFLDLILRGGVKHCRSSIGGGAAAGLGFGLGFGCGFGRGYIPREIHPISLKCMSYGGAFPFLQFLARS